MENMFVYGSLCKPSVRSVILGRSVETTEDFLDDYDKVDHSYFKVYPTIKKKAGKRVMGEMFEVNDTDLEILDRYETDYYKRIKVELVSGKEALTYIEA